MSLLGKILAVVNILAAVGFIYLAASDYGKRSQWSFAVFLHDRAIYGLPLDDNEKDVDDRPLVKDLSQSTLAEMFQGVGSPVSTQLKELESVQNDLHRKIDGDPMTVPNVFYGNPPTINLESAAQKRAWFLLPLARTLLERDELMNQVYNPKEEKITAERFDQKFTDVQAKADADDKKQALADLLFGLLEPGEGDLFASPAYKRFVIVVGRAVAIKAVDNQAAALVQLARETEDVLAAGRSAFAAAHALSVTHIRELAEVVRRENAALELQRAQTERQRQLVAERKRQVDDLQGKLEVARKTTRDYLNEQLKMQENLLKAERKLRDANSENRKLEQQIRSLEK
jgi:hypothetical protein